MGYGTDSLGRRSIMEQECDERNYEKRKLREAEQEIERLKKENADLKKSNKE